MKKALLFFSVFFILAFSASAQDDLGTWTSFQVNKSWPKVTASFRAEHRSNQKISATDAWFLSPGVDYRFTKWLTGSLSYEYWQAGGVPIHKAIFAVTGTLRREALSVALRQKYELSFNNDGTCGHNWRSRLKAQYAIPGSVFRPYVMPELFFWSHWNRTLCYVGTDIVVGKNGFFDIFYMYHIPNGAVPVHLIGVGFYLTL